MSRRGLSNAVSFPIENKVNSKRAVRLLVALAVTLAGSWAPTPAAAQGAGDCVPRPGGPTCPGVPGPAGAGEGSELSIVAQENLWFTALKRGGINYLSDGKLMIPFEPLLGLTASSDVAAKMQEMQWFFRYTGQTSRNAVFSVEWLAPRDLVDRNLRKTFLPLIERTYARWNIFYDPVLASVWRGLGPGPVDFSRPEIQQMFRSDMEYLRKQYFDHPNYWKIRGRPVMHVWAATELVRNGDDLFAEAIKSGIYICGDVFGQVGEEPPLDCRTGFTAATPDIVGRSRTQSVREVLSAFQEYFEEPTDKDMIPAFSFQYDDVSFRTSLGLGGTAIQILARGRNDLRAWLRLAERHAEPIDGTRYLWVGTLNGWAESTSIYPTEKGDAEFWREGDPLTVQPYHYAKLEELQKELFPEAPYRNPRIKVRDDGAILFENCDVLGGVRINAKIDGVSRKVRLENQDGVEFLPNFDRIWRPDFSFDKLTIRVKNLDGTKGRAVIRPRSIAN